MELEGEVVPIVFTNSAVRMYGMLAVEYELLRDTVLIMVAIMALLIAIVGIAMFQILQTKLSKSITEKNRELIDEECCRLRGQIDIEAGVMQWIAKRYDRAVELTQRGLEQAESLLPEGSVICAKSNSGFYYAEIHRKHTSWHLKEEAIALTKIGYDKYNPTIERYHQPDWVDNYIFVRAAFVRTAEERDEVLTLIKNLLAREDLKRVHRYLRESRHIMKPTK